MGRKSYTRPVPKVTIHISEDSYEILEGCKEGRLHEPKYLTVNRVLKEYLQYRGVLHNLQGQIEERDFVIQDLRHRLEAEREKLEVQNVQ